MIDLADAVPLVAEHLEIAPENARRLLTELLTTGTIPGICVECGRPRAITIEEWQAGYDFDCRTNTLIRWDGLNSLYRVRVCEKAILENLRIRKEPKRPGTPPDKTERVKAEMRRYSTADLDAMKVVVMATLFRAGRTLCAKAREEVRSERRNWNVGNCGNCGKPLCRSYVVRTAANSELKQLAAAGRSCHISRHVKSTPRHDANGDQSAL
jgi:hypothetical protein